MIPALRGLSEHAHTEWRLSVEHRVRRLENWVVFPVFGAVLGLLLLLSAVPLVPLLSLNQSLQTKSLNLKAGGDADLVLGNGILDREFNYE